MGMKNKEKQKNPLYLRIKNLKICGCLNDFY